VTASTPGGRHRGASRGWRAGRAACHFEILVRAGPPFPTSHFTCGCFPSVRVGVAVGRPASCIVAASVATSAAASVVRMHLRRHAPVVQAPEHLRPVHACTHPLGPAGPKPHPLHVFFALQNTPPMTGDLKHGFQTRPPASRGATAAAHTKHKGAVKGPRPHARVPQSDTPSHPQCPPGRWCGTCRSTCGRRGWP
jgi:hypothetical protein